MDTPIMLLFFNRPELLQQVFAAVREMRPKELFLVQDGPRKDRPDDIVKIQKCREIVEDVDWPCQVYRNYSEMNLSCDHREYTGISWCFEHVDRLIILEDDCVPSNSFLELCDELLERYKDNEHIHSISGFNRVNEYPCEYDYIFSKSSAGLGWATWGRTWKKVQELVELEFIEDKGFIDYQSSCMDVSLQHMYRNHAILGNKARQIYKTTGAVFSWEYLHGMSVVLNDMLVITPSKNMIKYIGISSDATHCVPDTRLLTHKVRKVLTQPSYEIDFPLKHPPFIIRDTKFERLSTKSMKSVPLLMKIESALLKVRYGEWNMLKQSIIRRIKK